VAGIWRELLGVEKVGVFTHFFDYGGHSLLVTQMIARLRDTFGVQAPMHVLFEMGRVADVASVLAEHEPKPGHVEKVAQIHLRLMKMSDGEAEALLAAKRGAKEELA